MNETIPHWYEGAHVMTEDEDRIINAMIELYHEGHMDKIAVVKVMVKMHTFPSLPVLSSILHTRLGWNGTWQIDEHGKPQLIWSPPKKV